MHDVSHISVGRWWCT